MEKIFLWFSRSEDIVSLKAIRRGLMLTIPILLIGSFCIILLDFPVDPYQDFIKSLPFFSPFVLMVYNLTLGIFSLYATASISICYSQAYMEKHGDFFIHGAPFAALAAFFLLVGFGSDGFSLSVMSARSLIIAIVTALVASALYCAFVNRPRRRQRTFGNTTDNVFNRALTSILPITAVVVIAGVINTAISTLFDVSSLEELISQGISSLFSSSDFSLGGGLFYLFLDNLTGFFGMHGGTAFDGMAQVSSIPGAAQGTSSLVVAGRQQAQIITKPFMDVFASIGGAGALSSLLLAILVFGRKRNMKSLAKLAAVPMVFNVSEVMLFGLPVLWNPLLLLPFILVPLISLSISYGATLMGLVPVVTADVSWITPPLLSGYLATGSFAGLALQAVNLVVGTFVYLPFMRLHEKSLHRVERNEFEGLLRKFRLYEVEKSGAVLTTLPGAPGLLVKALSDDLRQAVEKGSFNLYYQPQFDVMNRGIGAEALLRWNHPIHGMMYPPLVVKLAEEEGILQELEEAVMVQALDDALRIQRLANVGVLREDFSIGVNVTVKSLQNEAFVNKLIEGFAERHLDPGRLVLEATEHDVLQMTDDTASLLTRLVAAGIPLAIDDFSMSNVSFKYLETSVFSIVKLDSIVAKGIMESTLYASVASSVIRLSEQLYFKVLAEYVETPEQRSQLEGLGCTYFQGFLYSQAVVFEDMIKLVEAPAAAPADAPVQKD